MVEEISSSLMCTNMNTYTQTKPWLRGRYWGENVPMPSTRFMTQVLSNSTMLASKLQGSAYLCLPIAGVTKDGHSVVPFCGYWGSNPKSTHSCMASILHAEPPSQPLCFSETVSLCSVGWPKFSYPPASASMSNSWRHCIMTLRWAFHRLAFISDNKHKKPGSQSRAKRMFVSCTTCLGNIALSFLNWSQSLDLSLNSECYAIGPQRTSSLEEKRTEENGASLATQHLKHSVGVPEDRRD